MHHRYPEVVAFMLIPMFSTLRFVS